MNRFAVPLMLLASGVLFAGAGLAFVVAKGTEAPLFALVFLLIGVMDGVAGVVWTSVRILWGKQPVRDGSGPGGAAVEAERERDRLRPFLAATGALAILFLCILAAVAFYIPLIFRWLRGSGLW